MKSQLTLFQINPYHMSTSNISLLSLTLFLVHNSEVRKQNSELGFLRRFFLSTTKKVEVTYQSQVFFQFLINHQS
jgi:hypothetical protein